LYRNALEVVVSNATYGVANGSVLIISPGEFVEKLAGSLQEVANKGVL
jgi:hypothetical protein